MIIPFHSSKFDPARRCRGILVWQPVAATEQLLPELHMADAHHIEKR
jgi:hypothetical protein